MAVRYNKLSKLLIDKNTSNSQLADTANISGNTMPKTKCGQYVSLGTAEKLCNVLDRGVDVVLEFVPSDDTVGGVINVDT